MTHATYELSTDGAAPVELYTFTVPGTSLVWRYCTDTVPLTVASLVYLPEAITRSAITRTVNEPSSDLTVEVGDENSFALALFAGLTARPVEVLVRQFHRGDPDAQLVNVFTGFAAGVAFDDAKASITCVPRLSVASRRRVPWQTYQATCNWQLFSAGCTLDRATWVRGPYSLGSAAFSGPAMTISGTHADGDLSNGYVERVADGDRRFIEQNVGGVLTLQAAFPGVTGTAEDWRVYPGCRRTEADCSVRFNNLVHFLGWPRLPALNPFGRSAFYLSGAAEPTPPAGTSDDLGGGYSLILSPQTAGLQLGGGYGGLPSTTITLTMRVDGLVTLAAPNNSQPGYPTVLSATFPTIYVQPRPCPPAVVAGQEVMILSSGIAATVTGGGGTRNLFVTVGSGFDTWRPLTSDLAFTIGAQATTGSGSSGGATRSISTTRPVTIRIRDAATGLVRVEGTMNLTIAAIAGASSSEA